MVLLEQPPSILVSALASAIGLPVSLAPVSSARYSRFLDTPSWTSMAARGTRMYAANAMIAPPPLSLLLNMEDHMAIVTA